MAMFMSVQLVNTIFVTEHVRSNSRQMFVTAASQRNDLVEKLNEAHEHRSKVFTSYRLHVNLIKTSRRLSVVRVNQLE